MRPLVIAAPFSGCGKTTITLGLLAALRRRGRVPAPFKVGPDFIDPGHHAAAAGRDSRNLDGWMCGEAQVREIFARGCAGADLAVVEGVMGLFDGASGDSDAGATAEVARWLDGRIVLVVDARAQARSAAAMVQGFCRFDPRLTFAGVIFNRVGSPRHAELLRQAIASVPGLPPVLGCLPRVEEITLPERHLGLVTAEDLGKSEDYFARLADWLEEYVDVDRMFTLPLAPSHQGRGNVTQKEGRDERFSPSPRVGEGRGEGDKVRIGVARDEAFCFCYRENLDRLTAAGAELVFFSPLGDAHLPVGCAGLYLPGGYPELHANRLAGNKALLAEIRAFAASGKPVYAECGGLIYLTEGVVPDEPVGAAPCVCPDSGEHTGSPLRKFVGLFPVRARMLPRRKALGYRQVTLTADSLLGPAGTTARGHEFHYSEIDMPPQVARTFRLARADGGELPEEGFVSANVLASYVHLHFASNPALAGNFVAACRNKAVGADCIRPWAHAMRPYRTEFK